jgi:predicted secreted protein
MFDKFFRELAKKYNLDERIIREVCQSPFRFVSRSMKNANIKPIKLMYIGKILPKKISRSEEAHV